MIGLHDSVFGVFDRFKHPNSASSERNIAIRTASIFARFDPFITSYAWNASENDTPKHFQENVREGINKIERNLRELGDDQALSDAEAIDKILETSKAIETLVQKQEPPENMLYFTESSDFNGSNLDACVVLKDNIRKGLQTFLCVLAQQLQCHEEGHFVRLKLDGFLNQIDAQARLFFDAYLSARDIWTRPQWVHSRCTITKYIETPVPTGCGILRTAEDQNEDLNILLEENQQFSNFPLNPRQPECLSTTLPRVQLDDRHPLKSLAAPTKSLWSLLNRFGANHTLEEEDETSEVFYPQDKEMICLNLALSLLHLPTSHWKRVSWCSDGKSDEGIFFLKDPATQRITNKTHPYLSYRLHDRPESKDDLNLACDPQLLDFGKLIMEIHQWKRVNPSHKSGMLSKEELRLYLLNRISSNHFSRRDGMFKQAVKACLNAAGKEAAQDGINKDSLRNYIFEKIVRPLDHYAGFPKFSPDVFNDTSSTKPENTQDSYFDWKREDDSPNHKVSRAQVFLDNMENFVETHIKPNMRDDSLPAHLNKKVRIAVIDSGISKHDPLIRRACQTKQIRECRNFSSNEYNDCDDKLGHGTMVTRLLLDVAPRAELFIAKVTSDTDQQIIPKNKLYAIAKAINRAVHIWNVDIITMSLALKEEHPDIDEELEEALDPAQGKHTRKIIFAAAGNNKGGNSRRSWPARKEGVIAVHVTDGLGESVNINPSSEGEICFATLGHDIKHTWYGEDDDDGKDIYISGTSFATPIAAGIAANVMEYARHHIDDLNEERKKRLYSAPCMKEIFKAISQKRGDYYYVQPWTFWAERMRGGQWRNKDFISNQPGNIGLALKIIIAST